MFTSTYTGEGTGTGMFGSWGFIIFLLFILWFFFGMNKESYCNQDARADRIAETAKIEYNNLLETRNAKEAIMAQASAIRNEQQAEAIFDLKLDAQTKELRNGQIVIAKDAKIEALQAELSRKDDLCEIKATLAQLMYNMPVRPPYYAQGFINCGQSIPTNGFY